MRVLQLKTKKDQDPLRVRFNADAGVPVAFSRYSSRLSSVEVHSGRSGAISTTRSERPTCAAYSWDGEYLAVGTADGFARPYRVAGGAPLAELRVSNSRGQGHIGDVTFAPTIDPARQWLAACGNEFWVWNPVTQQYLIAPDEDWYLGGGVRFCRRVGRRTECDGGCPLPPEAVPRALEIDLRGTRRPFHLATVEPDPRCPRRLGRGRFLWKKHLSARRCDGRIEPSIARSVLRRHLRHRLSPELPAAGGGGRVAGATGVRHRHRHAGARVRLGPSAAFTA